MTGVPTLYVTDRLQWRAWLKANHSGSRGVWLIYYKRQSGKPRIPYDDAVEEAICFGWIDSLIKRIDDESFMQKFTPRTNCTNWSDLNRRRVAALHKAGMITPAGLAKIPPELLNSEPKPPSARRVMPQLPPAFAAALARAPSANRYFQKLAASYRRNFILWISAAKRPETQARRIAEAVSLLKQNKRLGMK